MPSMKDRAHNAIAQGALTNSKRPESFIEGIYPTHAKKGIGPYLYCGDKKYLDYICGLGVNLLGYGNDAIAEDIFEQYLYGSCLSLSSELEIEVAEKLKSIFLWPDLWKFLKTGSDACSAAIKIARSYTKRDLVLSQSYHGWNDDFVSLTYPALGVPKRDFIKSFDLNLIPEAACVIIEPVETEFNEERREFLKALRSECSKYGTILIFDEIITGFRFKNHSVSRYYGIEPDLIVLGKALGGGLPLSAVGGKKEVMNCGDYFISGTFFGEQVSLRACLTFLNLMTKDHSKYSVNTLWEKGKLFYDKFNKLSPEVRLVGYPSRGVFQGDALTKALFFQEACKAGILFGPSWFLNFAMFDYMDITLKTCEDIFRNIKNGRVRLEGNMPVTPFAQKMRGK